MEIKKPKLKNLEIIADSGGTKTDWIISNEKNELLRFTTESYHPRNLNSDFIIRNQEFWKAIPNLINYTLSFYGSGCLKFENAIIMTEALSEIGFNAPNVFSDLEGAAKALKLENGWAAICGTGSVVYKLVDGKVTEIRGGLGRELGDEGSGYYFGKLLANSILKNDISVPTISKDELNDENLYSTFANKMSDSKFESKIKQLHCLNIQLLIDSHLEGINTISFVGSYAFHQQAIFKELLEKAGIEVASFIERPIDVLAD